jgi:hypothetical protein
MEHMVAMCFRQKITTATIRIILVSKKPSTFWHIFLRLSIDLDMQTNVKYVLFYIPEVIDTVSYPDSPPLSS